MGRGATGGTVRPAATAARPRPPSAGGSFRRCAGGLARGRLPCAGPRRRRRQGSHALPVAQPARDGHSGRVGPRLRPSSVDSPYLGAAARPALRMRSLRCRHHRRARRRQPAGHPRAQTPELVGGPAPGAGQVPAESIGQGPAARAHPVRNGAEHSQPPRPRAVHRDGRPGRGVAAQERGLGVETGVVGVEAGGGGHQGGGGSVRASWGGQWSGHSESSGGRPASG